MGRVFTRPSLFLWGRIMATRKLNLLHEVAQLAASGIPLTDAQATVFLQLAEGTLAVWRAKKRGPRFVLVGTSPRYLKPDLDAYLAELKPQKRVSDKVGRPRGKRVAP